MFKNYLYTAFRNFSKNKSYIIINAFGLGIALACCISAYIILAFNIEFDSTFDTEKLRNTYRVHTIFNQPEGGTGQHIMGPITLAPALASDIPGVKMYSRFNYASGFVRIGENSFSETVAFADSTFFEMFDYKLVKGDFATFNQINSIAISKEVAEKFFPNQNPIGEVLAFNFQNQKKIQVIVGSVFEKSPSNSSLIFELMMRMEHFMDIYNLDNSTWGDWRDPATFITLTENTDPDNFSKQLQPYVDLRNEMRPDVKVTAFELELFKKPINQDDVNWSIINMRISFVPLVIFSLMALMILLIACFNLTNTSFALTARRLKEVGIRKVVGASRAQIVTQFLTEMLLIIILSLVVGIIMAKFIGDEFTEMWGLGYSFGDLNGLNLFVALIGLIFVASMMAGLYPALANSSFQPVDLLKSKVKMKGANWFTKSLVTLQFAISVLVMVNGIVFIQNTKFQEGIDFGYAMDEVLVMEIQSEQDYKIMLNHTLKNPKIKVSAISHHALGWSYPFPVNIDTTEYQVQHVEVGEGFFETMGLKLSSGRFLQMQNVTDQTQAVVVNKAFLKKTKLEDPLNQFLIIRGEKLRIVGIIEDHVDNLYNSKDAEPVIFYGSKPYEYGIMLVRTSSEDINAVKKYLEDSWTEEFPERPFFANTQEDNVLGGMRQTNGNLKKIFLFLTILGALLSISGIYALASLNIEKRMKEIGIRKVLGGSVAYLVQLLSREFAYILLVACILGSIGGYFMSNLLLDEIYAYHISVGAFPLVFSSVVIFSLGILATGSITARAALGNPVSSLRSE